MALVTLNDLTIGFRGPPLLDGVNCRIEEGDKIGLLGRNGAGKTTLMRLLTGDVEPDSGSVDFANDVNVAFLPQDIPAGLSGSIREVIAGGVAPRPIEEEWKGQHEIEQVMSRMQLQPDARVETLSSGMKRRVLLGRAIVSRPDLLLLDEPTNHLDIEAIDWLETFLSGYRGTLLFVTHDRMFLRKLATRILEIDRGDIFDWSCDYNTFVTRKEAALEAEEKQNALFDKKLAEEEVWIRQGIKARRTRNEGRVRALKELRKQRAERRSQQGKVRLDIQQAERSGTIVADVKHVSFGYDHRKILDDFSTTIMRGDNIGIIGPNGAGKSTLLRVLLGQLEPQAGTVKLGTKLEVAYFDQQRQQLDEELTVQENVSEQYDTVGTGDRRQHVIGYLQNFLFSPERARTQVKFLSGGERNRVLLAKLFAKPANVIVLDEPTNDLDTETLEMLESRLVEFPGTVLLVSHDREFLNNIVGSTIVFEPGGVKEYVGGYDDWLRQRKVQEEATSNREAEKRKTNMSKAAAPAKATETKRKLSFNEKRELESLPTTIEQLESNLAALHEQMADPDFYKQGGDEIAEAQARHKALESEIEQAYGRWEELEQL